PSGGNAPAAGAGVPAGGRRGAPDGPLLPAGGEGGVAAGGPAAAGANVKGVLLEAGDLFGREGLAVVLGVAGLAADGTLGVGSLGRPGGDDVGRRGFGRSRGVLATGSKLLAQLGDLGLKSVHLRLQPPAAGTRLSVAWFHARDSMSFPTTRLPGREGLPRFQQSQTSFEL